MLRQFVGHHNHTSYTQEVNIALGARDDSEAVKQQLDNLYADVCVDAETWCQDHWRSQIEHSWLTSNVLSLAGSIKELQSFDTLPILADALQDAGCEHEYILDHLRKSRNHVRCCVFVDLLLNCTAEG
jgi:hypothetical protein